MRRGIASNKYIKERWKEILKCPYCIKICTKCKRILVANEMNFNKQKRGKYSLNSKCRQCRKKYREEHKEEISEYKKQYIKDNKEKISEYQKQWYKDNKEKISEYQKQWYKDNKEEVLDRQRQYNKDNPEKIFNGNFKRRLREEYQGNGITKEQWYEMMEFFEWKCAYCGEYLGGKENDRIRSIDHISPLFKDGENEPWNCVPMLRNLNSSKYISDMEDWYIKQDFFNIDRLLKIYEWIEYAYKKWK